MVRTVAWQRADGNRGHSIARMATVDGHRLFQGCEVVAGPVELLA